MPGTILRRFSGVILWVWAHDSVREETFLFLRDEGVEAQTVQWLLARQRHTYLSPGFHALRKAASQGAVGLLLAAQEGRNQGKCWPGRWYLFSARWPRKSNLLLPGI